MQYNVAIIGGGIGGLMTAYNLKKNNPKISVCVIDKGHTLDKRSCPASKGTKCTKCKVCSITCGIAGAGAYSDGKFCIGTSYGGTLADKVGEEEALANIRRVDRILTGMLPEEKRPKVYQNDTALRLKCLQNNLRLLDMDVRHYGTDGNQIVMSALFSNLVSSGVEFIVDKDVSGVLLRNEEWYLPDADVCCDYIVIATGRGGSDFVTKFCKQNDIRLSSNSVDIGVRVEMDDIIWKEFSDKIYEPKILYRTKEGNRLCRMFCFNRSGVVSIENNNGIITANGHAYSDTGVKTKNCNFAILASTKFTEPFDKPTEYAEHISRLANIIGNGSVIVQRLGDLMNHRRSTKEKIIVNSVVPTMQAEAGDISLVLPSRILDSIKETILAFDKVAPGIATPDTLLYACESKYYSVRPDFINNSFEVSKNAFIIGDGSGVSRGLSQAGAMGLICADAINERL